MFDLLITYTAITGKKTKKRIKDVRPDISATDLTNLEQELLKIDTPKYGMPRTKKVEIQLIETQTEIFSIKHEGNDPCQPEPPVDEGKKAPKEKRNSVKKETRPRPRRLPSESQIAKWKSKTVATKIVAYAREDLEDACRIDECLRAMQQEAAFINSHLLKRDESMCREVYQDFLAKIFLAEEWTPQMLAAFKSLKNLLKNNLRGQLKRSLYVRERVLRNVFLTAQKVESEGAEIGEGGPEVAEIEEIESEASSPLQTSA